MSLLAGACLVLVLALGAYLVVALLRPEYFE